MAQKVQITLVDDIDGGPATETVSFSLDGVAYEIDLSEANSGRLREALAPYVGTARRLGGRSGGGAGGRRGRPRGGNNRIAEIRAWARENGHKVNERGRIPADITAAFEKAHS
jgi:Lsr2